MYDINIVNNINSIVDIVINKSLFIVSIVANKTITNTRIINVILFSFISSFKLFITITTFYLFL